MRREFLRSSEVSSFLPRHLRRCGSAPNGAFTPLLFSLYYIFVILSTPFSFFLTIFSQNFHNPQKNFISKRRFPRITWPRTAMGIQGNARMSCQVRTALFFSRKCPVNDCFLSSRFTSGCHGLAIRRMRQQPKKQLYLFQFLLECSFHGCILQVTLATGLLPEKMNVECQTSVEKLPNVLN